MRGLVIETMRMIWRTESLWARQRKSRRWLAQQTLHVLQIIDKPRCLEWCDGLREVRTGDCLGHGLVKPPAVGF